MGKINLGKKLTAILCVVLCCVQTTGCEEKCNYITRDPECLFLLGRYNRPSGISTWEFMKKALKGSAK